MKYPSADNQIEAQNNIILMDCSIFIQMQFI